VLIVETAYDDNTHAFEVQADLSFKANIGSVSGMRRLGNFFGDVIVASGMIASYLGPFTNIVLRLNK
jgi:hypothetical protein